MPAKRAWGPPLTKTVRNELRRTALASSKSSVVALWQAKNADGTAAIKLENSLGSWGSRSLNREDDFSQVARARIVMV